MKETCLDVFLLEIFFFVFLMDKSDKYIQLFFVFLLLQVKYVNACLLQEIKDSTKILEEMDHTLQYISKVEKAFTEVGGKSTLTRIYILLGDFCCQHRSIYICLKT